ncbi:hypothetical protein K438DRAFT_1416821, partial [Mycena galopus ATCC 62051]
GIHLTHATQRMDFVGCNVTEYLVRKLSQLGYTFTRAENALVRDLKESLCHVVQDFEQE